MNDKKNILFLINGLGLGNSTRCEALIIEMVSKGYHIIVATSGNAFKYFQCLDIPVDIIELEQHLYGKNAMGELSIFRTFLNFPKLFFTFIKNVITLYSTIKKKSTLSAVFFDSEYSIFPLKPFISAPFIGINNAHIIIEYFTKGIAIPKSLKAQLFIEKLDRLFYNLVADHIICPTLSSENNSSTKITICPPIVRKTVGRRKKSTEVKEGLIMLSGSQFKTDLSFVAHDEFKNIRWSLIGQPQEFKGVKNLGKVYNNKRLLAKADLMIINAGFSAVSEAAVLGIPALVLPINNHAEQFVNAQVFSDQGYGIKAEKTREREALNTLINEYSFYSSQPRLPNGVDDAINKIMEIIDGYDR